MQRKKLQPYVVYAYGWSADGSAALPLVLLKTREIYQRTYGGAEIKYRPSGSDELVQAGARTSEAGYLAVLGNVDTRISEMAAIPQTTDFLGMAVHRDFRLPVDMHVTLITRPGYINGPWADRAEVYEASREAARKQLSDQEESSRQRREQAAARDQAGTRAAQRLTAAGYPARYEYGGVLLDVVAATGLANAVDPPAGAEEHDLEMYPSDHLRNNAARLDLGQKLTQAIDRSRTGDTTRILDEGTHVASIVPARTAAS